MEKKIRIAVTGHRPNKIGGYDPSNPTRAWIYNELTMFLYGKQEEYEEVIGISGMALGIDQDFARACNSLKIPWVAAIPFKGQESMWPPASQAEYYELLKKAWKTWHVCEPGYAAWKMQKRNEWMVDKCDLLVAVWDGTSGGTANCVAYAKQKGKPIYLIDPLKRVVIPNR